MISANGLVHQNQEQRQPVTLERLEEVASSATQTVARLSAEGVAGGALLAGFLDRYRMTLAARIDGLRRSIDMLQGASQRCADRFPEAARLLEKAISTLGATRRAFEQANEIGKNYIAANLLPAATDSVADHQEFVRNITVCMDKVAQIETRIASLEITNRAMSEGAFLADLQAFTRDVVTADGDRRAVLQDALTTYSPLEQSLGYLKQAAYGYCAGFAVRYASHAVCTNILGMSEKRATIVSDIAGLGTGAYVMLSGAGLLQTAKIGLYALGTKKGADVIGVGLRAVSPVVSPLVNGVKRLFQQTSQPEIVREGQADEVEQPKQKRVRNEEEATAAPKRRTARRVACARAAVKKKSTKPAAK